VSYIDTTFERGGKTIKTVAKVYGGWDSTKKTGCQFYDQQFLDYKGDITLLRHMIVINLPVSKRGDYKEWDLLPFLPGGLIERNRRKH